MTSELGYPDYRDTFGPVVDSHRCGSTHPDTGQRCQLFGGHDGAHAHAWLEPIGRPPGRGRPYPWHPHVERWTDARATWSERHPGRLPWCCMFRA